MMQKLLHFAQEWQKSHLGTVVQEDKVRPHVRKAEWEIYLLTVRQ